MKTLSTKQAMEVLHKHRARLISDGRRVAVALIKRDGATHTRAILDEMDHCGMLDGYIGEDYWLGAVVNIDLFVPTGERYTYGDAGRNIHERSVQYWKLREDSPRQPSLFARPKVIQHLLSKQVEDEPMTGLRIVQGDRIAPRVRAFFYSVVAENGDLLARHLTQQEAESFVESIGRGELGKPHKLPRPEIGPLSWEGCITGEFSLWTTDSKIVFLRSSVRNNKTSIKLAQKLAQTVSDAETTHPEKFISKMVEQEGGRATTRAKVWGMIHTHDGPVALVEAEGGVKARLDARRLSLLGAVANGTLHMDIEHPYAPVAFKRGETTVGLIMPLSPKIRPTGEEAMFMWL